jgi:hypothetical protein
MPFLYEKLIQLLRYFFYFIITKSLCFDILLTLYNVYLPASSYHFINYRFASSTILSLIDGFMIIVYFIIEIF